MTILVTPLVIAVLGLVIYCVAPDTQPKLKEIGRLIFFCGFLVFVFALGTQSKILPWN